jgi:2-keto-4-pentenoate hydratase
MNMSWDREDLKPSERSAADAIFAARSDLAAIAPIRETFGIEDASSAYLIQETNTRRWLAMQRPLVGRKIGLTSKAVQAQLGVDEPDYGMLWGDLAFQDGDHVPLGRFMQPKIEAEIAFVMNSGIDDPDASLTDLMRAIAYCLPALEIVDSAIEKWNIKLVDTIADNASGGAFALGTSPRSIQSADLRLCGMLMSRAGEVVSSGLGAACLGHPLKAALWLARKMAEVGRPLQSGDIVLSGALGPMVNVGSGDRVIVEIQGFDPFALGFE